MTNSSSVPTGPARRLMRRFRSVTYRVIAPMLDVREERSNARIASLESRIDALELRIGALEAHGQELREKTAALADDNDLLRSDVGAVTRQISRLVDDAR